MTCPVCGTPHSCAHSRTGTAVLETSPSPAVEARLRADKEHWREEIVSRVRQHRARRRRFDPTASLELDFPADAPLMVASAGAEPPTSDLAQLIDEPAPGYEPIALTPVVRPAPRKIIRFPRQAAVAQAIVDLEAELAEPAPETPRILDAPEAERMELLPSFADIRLDEAPQADNFQEDLDLSGEPAPLHLRFKSGMVDAGIVFLALAMFAAVFALGLSRFAEAAPKLRPALVFVTGAASTLWLLFQYLFLVYQRRTPGMGALGLELSTFEGRRPSYFACCARALGVTLSGLSLGLGYFWALVDEHNLGWHDRISQTYLKSNQHSAISTQPM